MVLIMFPWYITQHPTLTLTPSPPPTVPPPLSPLVPRSPPAAFRGAMLGANAEMHAAPGVDDSMSGTTAVAALVAGGALHVANVGDSRAVAGLWWAGRVVVEDLSWDQTPFRANKRARVRARGDGPHTSTESIHVRPHPSPSPPLSPPLLYKLLHHPSPQGRARRHPDPAAGTLRPPPPSAAPSLRSVVLSLAGKEELPFPGCVSPFPFCSAVDGSPGRRE
jgi:hypothetical protein